MMHELFSEKLARKNPRSRNYHCGVGFPHQNCRLIHRRSSANNHNRCYTRNSGDCRLSDMETKARFQLVRKEDYHG